MWSHVTETGAELKRKFEFLPLTPLGSKSDPLEQKNHNAFSLNFEIIDQLFVSRPVEVSTVYFANASDEIEAEIRSAARLAVITIITAIWRPHPLSGGTRSR
jgi:ABC-type transporter lipoprotein component MlaA